MGESLLEYRRKNPSLESARSPNGLMSSSNFSLDDPVPHLQHGPVSKGFSQLPDHDRRNFLLLVLLYFLQGVPMGLASGSVPFLLKQHVSYAQMGVFSLASYPYSLKLLWSPIIDACWSPKLGRRKSWILPIQTLSGLGMIWLAGNIEAMMVHAGENNGDNVWGFTWWWFALVFMCATQDIAVDGWALTLLSHENLSYASTAQTVGLTAGQFLSSTVFLAFNSKDFANKWFRSVPGDTGLVTLSGALATAGWLYLIVTVGLALLKREELTKNDDGVWDVYKIMVGILKLKNVQTLIVVHLIAKIGFQANDGATTLKLLDKGLGQDNLALTVLIDFPFEIGLGYYVGKWSSYYSPMQLWSWGFMGRLVAAALAQFIVSVFPSGGVNGGYLLLVIIGHVSSTFMNTVMFVAVSAFHAKIADPVYGGTYMTLLATVSNLGGTFPRYFVLKFIDMFTVATCIPSESPPAMLKGELIASPFSCVLEPEQVRCTNGGGTCKIITDGYYIVNILCIVVGVVTFWGYIKPAVKKLQSLPIRAWRLAP
ncbi:acetyl-coenzyme A transporter 1 [Trichodelitschia bisporula]|uniref:Acetyl-coenzyme A transporter 1 n=1 Tax=Trichodelitschia bisporula TaxID=703511 RepID=A0A6G1HNQ7_9PEZI|nr:acetyl-coenzyme A transporter 1 [Trichodelitschia bisporula]